MRAGVMLLTVLPSLSLALDGFSVQVVLDERVVVNAPTLVRHTYDEGSFFEAGRPVKKRGLYTRASLSFVPEGSTWEPSALWLKWEPRLKKAGWQPVSLDGTQYTLKRTDAKVESWLSIALGNAVAPVVTLVRVEGAPTELKLEPPAATAGAVDETSDWPFVGHFPKAVLSGTSQRSDPLVVEGDGVKTETRVVADGSIAKRYTPPSTLSPLETMLSYQAALTRAGWVVEPLKESTTTLLAHFNKNGRDLWLEVGRADDDSDSGLTYAVADLGADALSKALATDCKLTLRGVNFEFNTATLTADSKSALVAVTAALTARPKLKFEVQGHTDTVGDDGFNLKFSQSRAQTVRSWLTSHGVAAARLSAKGFGKKVPIAENDTDRSRARNRRIELVCKK